MPESLPAARRGPGSPPPLPAFLLALTALVGPMSGVASDGPRLPQAKSATTLRVMLNPVTAARGTFPAPVGWPA